MSHCLTPQTARIYQLEKLTRDELETVLFGLPLLGGGGGGGTPELLGVSMWDQTDQLQIVSYLPKFTLLFFLPFGVALQFSIMEYIHSFRETYAYDDPLVIIKPWVDATIKPHVPARFQSTEIVTNNLHTLVFGVALYSVLFQLSKLFLLVPSIFKTLKTNKNRLDFCARVVSFIQAIIICILGIPVFNNEHLSKDHIFATTPYSKFYTCMALAYFVWDTIISTVYVKYFGIGFLLHGVVSTIVFTIASEYEFIQYYSAAFLLFELSTPFLDIRWLGLKFKCLSNTVELLNNIILILIFFFIRICWGWYQVGKLALDLYPRRNEPGFTITGAIIILGCNFVLDILNVFWFSKMLTVAIETLKGMFGFTKNTSQSKLKLM